MKEFFTIATVANFYFSDHDAMRIVIEKSFFVRISYCSIKSNIIRDEGKIYWYSRCFIDINSFSNVFKTVI